MFQCYWFYCTITPLISHDIQTIAHTVSSINWLMSRNYQVNTVVYFIFFHFCSAVVHYSSYIRSLSNDFIFLFRFSAVFLSYFVYCFASFNLVVRNTGSKITFISSEILCVKRRLVIQWTKTEKQQLVIN